MQLQKLLQQNKYQTFSKGIKISVLSLFFLPLFLWSDAHIFVYHRFDDSRYPTTNTTAKELKKEFDYFKDNGYKVIKLSSLIRALKNHKEIDDKWVVLTIDDNFKSFYQNGLKFFKKYHYPFSIFVYVEATEKKYPDYTSWKELKEISKYGDIEFHSYSHPHMTYKSDIFLRNDFKKGFELLKKRLGITPKYFAYPYGEYNSRVKNIAKEFGFQAILNQNIGAVSSTSDIFDLDRNALVGKSNLKRDLNYKELHIDIIKPKTYPNNGILKKIVAKLYNTKYKSANFYLSGYGWQKLDIKNGFINKNINKKLIRPRSRLAISINNSIKTKLLIKDKYGNK